MITQILRLHLKCRQKCAIVPFVIFLFCRTRVFCSIAGRPFMDFYGTWEVRFPYIITGDREKLFGRETVCISDTDFFFLYSRNCPEYKKGGCRVGPAVKYE